MKNAITLDPSKLRGYRLNVERKTPTHKVGVKALGHKVGVKLPGHKVGKRSA